MPDNEIRLKITIDGKESLATISLTQQEINKLASSVRLAGDESRNAGEKLVHSFAQARNLIQGLKETFSIFQSAFASHLTAYHEQEAALVKLNTALQQTNQYTKENVKSLTDYAAQLQQTTIYGDEVTETVMAQLLAMGLTVEQTKQATLQAANLATVMGTDLNTAARAMADLFNGNTGLIGRYVKGLDEAIIKSGDLDKILTMLNERIGGQAEAMGRSAIGAVARMNNAIGDLKENAGELLSKALSPLIEIISNLISHINNLSPALSGLIGIITSLTGAIIILNSTGIAAFVKNIVTGIIPAIISLKTNLMSLQLILGPAGWLTLGLTAIAGLWFSIAEGQKKAAENLKIYNEQANKLRLSEINKELLNPNIDSTRKFLLEKERERILNEYLMSPHEIISNKTKTKGDEKEFKENLQRLEIIQMHQANMLKIETDNDLILLNLQKQHLEQRKKLYIKYGQDITEINYRIKETEAKINKELLQEHQEANEKIINIVIDEMEELGDIIYGNVLEYARLSKQQELEIWYTSEMEKIKAYENFNEMKLALDEEYARRKSDIDYEVMQTSLEVYSNLFGALAQLFGKHTAAYKILAIAQTLIDTYQAAQAAYKSLAGIPVVGPTLAAIASATAMIQGMARVKAIQSVKIPGYQYGGRLRRGQAGFIEGIDNEIIAPEKTFVEIFKQELRPQIYNSNDFSEFYKTVNQLNKTLQNGIYAIAYLDDNAAKQIAIKGNYLNNKMRL